MNDSSSGLLREQCDTIKFSTENVKDVLANFVVAEFGRFARLSAPYGRDRRPNQTTPPATGIDLGPGCEARRRQQGFPVRLGNREQKGRGRKLSDTNCPSPRLER